MGAFTCEFGVVHKTCRCPTPHTIKCDKPQEHNPAGSETTGSGRWIQKKANKHRCNKPTNDSKVKAGDRWQCNTCHTIWEVTKVYYDQRDDSYSYLWKCLNKPDPDGNLYL